MKLLNNIALQPARPCWFSQGKHIWVTSDILEPNNWLKMKTNIKVTNMHAGRSLLMNMWKEKGYYQKAVMMASRAIKRNRSLLTVLAEP